MLAMEEALERLAAIPYFPSSDGAVLEIMHQLKNMIGAEIVYGSTPQERLDWLISAAINAMRAWSGIPELRGLYCSRWKPADRIEAYSSLPGYTAEDSESLALAAHQDRKAIEAGRKSPKLLEAAACDRMPEDELAQLHRDTIGGSSRRPDSPGARGNLSRRQSANSPKLRDVF